MTAASVMARYPVTLSFAKKIGQLMVEFPDNFRPNLSYGYCMQVMADSLRLDQSKVNPAQTASRLKKTQLAN